MDLISTSIVFKFCSKHFYSRDASEHLMSQSVTLPVMKFQNFKILKKRFLMAQIARRESLQTEIFCLVTWNYHLCPALVCLDSVPR